MTLADDPKWSKQGAQVAQSMPQPTRDEFAIAMGKAKTIEDLPTEFANYLKYGYPKESNKSLKPDNITELLEVEWIPYGD